MIFWILIFVIAIGGAGTVLSQTVIPDSPGPDTTQAIGDPIAAVAANAGFQDNDLITAVAIALAESGGNPRAYNPETAAGTPNGRGSFGLWQIYRKAHPEFDSWNLFDPQQNANAAFSVYSDAGFSFSPWTTFKNRKYIGYLSTAQDRVNA